MFESIDNISNLGSTVLLWYIVIRYAPKLIALLSEFITALTQIRDRLDGMKQCPYIAVSDGRKGGKNEGN